MSTLACVKRKMGFATLAGAAISETIGRCVADSIDLIGLVGFSHFFFALCAPALSAGR
jgi:hypothetical protein